MKDIDPRDPRLEGALSDEPEFLQQEEQDDVSKLQSIIRELDLTGGVARIFRQTAGRAEFDYEGELPVDGFNLETIKRVYGGGRYIIRFAAKGGRYVRSIKFSVSPRHKGELETLNTPTPVNGNDNGNMIALLMQQAQQAAQQQQQMMTLMVTMMSESNKSMAQVIAAAISGNGRAAVPAEPASKTVELLMPLMIENMKPRGGTAEVVEQLKLLKELTGSEPKEEKEEDMMTKILNVGAPILGALMNRGQAQPPIPMPPPPAPLPAANPALPQAPAPDETAARRKAEELLLKLRLATPMLVKAAAENREIEPYLDTLDEMVDDEGYEMLCHLLEQPNWMTLLFGDNPGVLANRQWFENFRAVILAPDESDTKAAGPAAAGPQAAGSPLLPA